MSSVGKLFNEFKATLKWRKFDDGEWEDHLDTLADEDPDFEKVRDVYVARLKTLRASIQQNIKLLDQDDNDPETQKALVELGKAYEKEVNGLTNHTRDLV